MKGEIPMSNETPSSLRENQDRDLIVEVEAYSLDNMKKEAVCNLIQPEGTTFTMQCDEGPYLGGDDSAPPPLSIFTAGVAF
jgi:hypothetical protein